MKIVPGTREAAAYQRTLQAPGPREKVCDFKHLQPRWCFSAPREPPGGARRSLWDEAARGSPCPCFSCSRAPRKQSGAGVLPAPSRICNPPALEPGLDHVGAKRRGPVNPKLGRTVHYLVLPLSQDITQGMQLPPCKEARAAERDHV